MRKSVKKYFKTISIILAGMFLINTNSVFAASQSGDSSKFSSIKSYENYLEKNFDKLYNSKNTLDHKVTYDTTNQMKITTYQLEQTQVETVSDETSEKPIMAKTILFVASQNGSSTMNNTDSSVSITGTVTIYYSVVQVKATACYRLTKVTGSYRWLNASGSSVTSQTLYYAMSGSGSSAAVSEEGVKNPTGGSFAYNTGFSGAINMGGGHLFGATYTINLIRNSSGHTWNLSIANNI